MSGTEHCAGCGLEIEGGSEGCQALFDELLARDFSDARYFRVHRTMVDTYCLQHPERYCVSGKSLAAHLCGLCWALENEGGRAVGPEQLQRWLNGNPKIDKPLLPSHRGELTIADVRSAPDPASYANAVDRWARATWSAYRELQPLARVWLESASKMTGADKHGQKRSTVSDRRQS